MLMQGGSSRGGLRLMLLNGRKDLSKLGLANNYQASDMRRRCGGCGGWRDNRRCIWGTSLVTSDSGHPLGPGPFVGACGAVHTE
jgi:hypothetical protein